MMKIVQKIINAIAIIVIALSILALITVVLTPKGEAPNFLGFSLFRVTTGSMEPNIPTNSMIVVRRCSFNDVQVGDVISFYSNDPDLGGAVNTHRVTAIDSSTGVTIVTTKGDANHVVDEYKVYEKNFIGVVIGSSKALGTIQRLASNPLIFVPIIVVPLVIMLLSNIIRTIRVAKILVKEEEETARQELKELLEQNEALKKQKEASKEHEDAMEAAWEELRKAKEELAALQDGPTATIEKK